MRIPRLAFALMVAAIFVLSGSLFLVRARTATSGRVLSVTQTYEDGHTTECAFPIDGKSPEDPCKVATGTKNPRGAVLSIVRFLQREGNKAEVFIKAKYIPTAPTGPMGDLDDVPGERIWISPEKETVVSIPGYGNLRINGKLLDWLPLIPKHPEEPLEPAENEFRMVWPVLIRGNQVLFNGSGLNSIDRGSPDGALMLYLPGEGRFLVSTVPFDGAVPGEVLIGQIGFTVEGKDYQLLTAMPATRQPRVWVKHDVDYKVSEHLEGASNDKPMFLARSLRTLMSPHFQQ